MALHCALLNIFVEELRVTDLVVSVSLSVPCVPTTDGDVEEIAEAIDADASDASERLSCQQLVHAHVTTAQSSVSLSQFLQCISACLISSAGARRKRIRTPIDGASPTKIHGATRAAITCAAPRCCVKMLMAVAGCQHLQNNVNSKPANVILATLNGASPLQLSARKTVQRSTLEL